MQYAVHNTTMSKLKKAILTNFTVNNHEAKRLNLLCHEFHFGQRFPAHKAAAVAAYRDRCQTKKETHMQGHVQRT